MFPLSAEFGLPGFELCQALVELDLLFSSGSLGLMPFELRFLLLCEECCLLCFEFRQALVELFLLLRSGNLGLFSLLRPLLMLAFRFLLL